MKGEGLLRYDSSCLKTSMQKFIRRAQPAEAVAVGMALLKRDEANVLRRRLPVIAAEDVGWQVMWIAPICGTKPGESSDGDEMLLKMMEMLAETKPKDKSAEPLRDTATFENKVGPPMLSPSCLADALAARDEMAACRLLVAEMKEEKGAGGKPCWDVLKRAAAKTQLDGAVEVIEACRQRVGQGLYEGDRGLMSIACAQMVMHAEDGWAGKDSWANRAKPQVATDLKSIPWMHMDGHTWFGKIVQSIMKKKRGIDTEYLFWCWFCNTEDGSGLVFPAKDDLYLRSWDRQVRERFGETLEQMSRKWAEIRPEVESCAQWLMKERGLN